MRERKEGGKKGEKEVKQEKGREREKIESEKGDEEVKEEG